MNKMHRPVLQILAQISRGGICQNRFALPALALPSSSSSPILKKRCCRCYGSKSSAANHNGQKYSGGSHLRSGAVHSRQSRAMMVTMNKVDSVPKKTRPVVGSWQTTSEDELYDVVIVGGGMAGQAMACALGFEPSLGDHRILLLEQGKRPMQLNELPSKYSNRVCSLNHNSVKLLTDVGAWHHMAEMRVKPFRRMQVWDACSDALIAFNKSADLSEDMAYIVENDVTNAALSRQLGERGNIEVQYEKRLTSIQIPPQGLFEEESWAQLHLDDDSIIKTRLIIGADGARSGVRKLAGLKEIGWDYDQWGVVATLQLAEPTENIVAWQRFLPSGPIALLPLTDDQSSLVWSTSKEHSKELVNMDEQDFTEAVNNAFWDDSHHNQSVDAATQLFEGLLSVIKPDGSSIRQLPPSIAGVGASSRASFPLGLCHAPRYITDRVALIGDAAHRVHPLAGQGINLGFGDVTSLTQVLSEAASMGKDLGSVSHLEEYETQRQRHILPVMGTIDALKRLYSTDNPAAVLIRSLGLQATNALGPIKDRIIASAAT
ncbi:ubiquinone biosynthesis monooxygenase COQ6, mitochondrial [Strongylocentrotus purpuratus]|uniref:Ubiquinone biosynthesis monooxygenase COQ6, mitochondrial n=1 Tax=Strongylocentrotus purpuratus TaxID=7668 RepID=A0A7M7PSQ5_STRPU|nr:ubiquinone biosynthesis monooxygenase COQ6, mitochondrial [Strongylocentrotus purpuratus]